MTETFCSDLFCIIPDQGGYTTFPVNNGRKSTGY